MNRDYFIQLTTNLYRLTLLFPKKEPLRYKMRELGDEILASLLAFSNNNSGKSQAAFLTAEKNIEILDSFFEIAKTQNWLSPFDILEIQKGYNTIRDELRGLNGAKEDGRNLAIPLQEKTVSMNERQRKILEILKEKGQAQVWELKDIFPEVSKRTVRRDFKEMLKQGLIERIGEKNETFYRLKS
jgi:Fic family protein